MSLNINAKPFVPILSVSNLSVSNFNSSPINIRMFEENFKKMNSFIFEDEQPDLKFVLSLSNPPFEKVMGKRFKTLPKFKPSMFKLDEETTWADIAIRKSLKK